jgi:hypothetical protein
MGLLSAQRVGAHCAFDVIARAPTSLRPRQSRPAARSASPSSCFSFFGVPSYSIHSASRCPKSDHITLRVCAERRTGRQQGPKSNSGKGRSSGGGQSSEGGQRGGGSSRGGLSSRRGSGKSGDGKGGKGKGKEKKDVKLEKPKEGGLRIKEETVIQEEVSGLLEADIWIVRPMVFS